MSKYTVQVKSLVENNYKIFDFDYPLFDPLYKPVLEQKIIDYYYFREIGLETPAQFKQFLKAKLNKIMPYYNQLYSSNDVFKTYDPYKNKNVTTTDSRTNTSDISGRSDSTTNDSQTVDTDNTSSGTNNNKETFSDTPQAKLQSLDYATNYTETTGDTGGTETGNSTTVATGTGALINSGTATTTDQYTSVIAGHDGMKYPTDILMGLRASFINIDAMIIEELTDLFMNIY
jgi:hypothetical protein